MAMVAAEKKATPGWGPWQVVDKNCVTLCPQYIINNYVYIYIYIYYLSYLYIFTYLGMCG